MPHRQGLRLLVSLLSTSVIELTTIAVLAHQLDTSGKREP